MKSRFGFMLSCLIIYPSYHICWLPQFLIRGPTLSAMYIYKCFLSCYVCLKVCSDQISFNFGFTTKNISSKSPCKSRISNAQKVVSCNHLFKSSMTLKWWGFFTMSHWGHVLSQWKSVKLFQLFFSHRVGKKNESAFTFSLFSLS